MTIRKAVRLALAGAIAVGMLAFSAPTADAAIAVNCKVKNRNTGVLLQSADGSALTTTLAAASDGDVILIRNTCAGNFFTADLEGLQLVGQPTVDTPQATLDGMGAGTVLVLTGSVRVKNLKITNGNGDYDASGYATGGGIAITPGSLATLNGNTLVTGNTAEYGGGIQMWLTTFLDIRGNAMVTGNTAYGDPEFGDTDGAGGGIMTDCDGSTQGITPANVTGNLPDDVGEECW